MTRYTAWIGGALMLVTTTLAQSGGPAADPISGTWTGSVGPGAAPGYTITLDLKLDGTNAVTGSAQGQNPGDTAVVKTGTFDPQTGTLRLELQLKDAGATATFEGIAVLGTVTGRLSLSTQPGPGTFVLRRAASPEGAPAAPTPAGDANAVVARQLAQVTSWILKAADLVPADSTPTAPSAPSAPSDSWLGISPMDTTTSAAARQDGRSSGPMRLRKVQPTRHRCCRSSSSQSTRARPRAKDRSNR